VYANQTACQGVVRLSTIHSRLNKQRFPPFWQEVLSVRPGQHPQGNPGGARTPDRVGAIGPGGAGRADVIDEHHSIWNYASF
jgi:hypothetical protein